jgi:3',5'-cyclic-AMP phosphodiesterase
MDPDPRPRPTVRRRRTKPLRLLHLTDPHLLGEADGRLRGVATLQTLRLCVAHARRHHFPVDATLLTGDLVQDDPGGYRHLAAVFEGWRVPVHTLAGNHDVPREMQLRLASRPFDLAPIARYRDWVIFMLETVVPGKEHGHLDRETLRFLDEGLARHSDAHALVCLHHHPVPMGSAWIDQLGLDNAADLFARLGRHDNVRAVLWGHVHQARDEMRDGVLLLSTPSTCKQFLPESDVFVADERPPGYRWLHLYPDGRIDTRVVWVDAEEAPA